MQKPMKKLTLISILIKRKSHFLPSIIHSKSMKINNLYLISILFIVQTNLNAQTVGENTLIITSGFTPQIKDAHKIFEQPFFNDSVYTVTKFDYSIINTKITTPYVLKPITAAKMSGEPLDKIYNAYIAAGIGNLMTPLFEFRYDLDRSRDKRAGIQLKHLSSTGKMDEYIYPGFSDNLVKGYFTKMWDVNKLDFDASYSRTLRHFYGVRTADTALTNSQDISDTANEQIFHLAEGGLRFSKFNLSNDKMFYDLGLRYYFLIDKFGSRENGVKYDGIVDWGVDLVNALKEQRIGLKTEFNFYNNSDSLRINNSYIIGLEPFYKFKFNKLDAEIGFKADVAKDSISEIGIFPMLNFRIEAIENIMSFNAKIYGGSYKNNMKDVVEQNPFASSINPMEMSKNKLSTAIGMQTTFSRFINLNLAFNYEKWEKTALFINDTTIALRNRFTFVYDDMDMISLKAGLAFHSGKKLNILTEFNIYSYNPAKELYAWHKPDYDLKLLADYNLADKILIHADITYNGPSKAPIYSNGIVNAQTINPWLDASLGAEYRYHKGLGIFLNINNIAASKYSYWYNYPSYGFNIIGGLSYIF
ncbi:MAG: hypothetical protein AUJ98_11015 [Bacteroidetes bacterium CG2_30_33_31]|nr:MAG: hypothetical protein AUJ98_11015 [Bacteroidetes bacterium CG2_30_33_31]